MATKRVKKKGKSASTDEYLKALGGAIAQHSETVAAYVDASEASFDAMEEVLESVLDRLEALEARERVPAGYWYSKQPIPQEQPTCYGAKSVSY